MTLTGIFICLKLKNRRKWVTLPSDGVAEFRRVVGNFERNARIGTHRRPPRRSNENMNGVHNGGITGAGAALPTHHVEDERGEDDYDDDDDDNYGGDEMMEMENYAFTSGGPVSRNGDGADEHQHQQQRAPLRDGGEDGIYDDFDEEKGVSSTTGVRRHQGMVSQGVQVDLLD